MTDRNTYLLIWILPIVFLLLAVLHLPIGYYTFLRLIVCITSFWIAYLHKEAGLPLIWSGVFILVGILFNPIISVHLHRETWFWLDIAGAVIYLIHLIFYSKIIISKKN